MDVCDLHLKLPGTEPRQHGPMCIVIKDSSRLGFPYRSSSISAELLRNKSQAKLTANNVPGAGANAEAEATSAVTIETLNIIVI
jgi:hypothetical protein